VRILWLTHMVPYPPTGGSLLRTYHLLRQTARFAHVDVVAFVQDTLIPAGTTLADSVAHMQGFVNVLGTHSIPASSFAERSALAVRAALTGKSFTSSWTWSDRYAHDVRNALENRYDAVVLDTIGLFRNLPGSTRPPVFLNHHNEEVSMLERRAKRSGAGPRSAYFRLEARNLRAECARFFPSVASHFTVSALDLARLQEIDPRATGTVVANGVDTREYPVAYRREPTGTFDVLFIGGGTWYPNRDAMNWLVEEIWPPLSRRIPNARLVLVGRAPTEQAVQAAARDPRVIVTGYVDDVRPFAERASAFACPIRDGGGTRLKILHALSMGLPIVSTAIGMEGIEASPGREYLAAESPADFVHELARLAADERLGEALSAAGRQFVESTFDWDRIGSELERALTHGGGRDAH